MAAPSFWVGEDGDEGLQIVLEHESLTLDLERLETVLLFAISERGFNIRYLGIVLSDRDTVHELNRTYLDHDYPTDVVSFSLDDDAVEQRIIDGEVYVDLDMAAERAPEFGTSFEQEAARYAVHGVLHLTGLNDETDDQRQQMRHLEDAALAQFDRWRDGRGDFT